MTPLIIAALELAAPGLLGGSLGVAISVLKHPMAGRVAKVARGAARGDHLSDESKRIFAEYKRQYPYDRWADYR